MKAIAHTLAASDQYRIRRRLWSRLDASADAELKQAPFVDVQTTGLDRQSDEITELAILIYS